MLIYCKALEPVYRSPDFYRWPRKKRCFSASPGRRLTLADCSCILITTPHSLHERFANRLRTGLALKYWMLILISVLVSVFFTSGKTTASCLDNRGNSTFMHNYDPPSRPDDMCTVCRGIYDIYWINELLVFLLQIRSMNRFPFIHHMTFSLTRSYRGYIVESNFGVQLSPLTNWVVWGTWRTI